ncbi:SpoIIE family protein phosphatase [Halanaerobacter jeridensis]
MDEQQLLLDNIKTQVWYIKDPCTYVAANEARADFLGVDKEDIAYAEIDNLLSSEIAGSCKQDNQEVFKQKEIVKTQGWVRNAAGERRYHSITKIPKLNEHGAVEYVICSAEDITEQKKAEAKLNQYAEKLDEQIVKAQQLHEKFLPSKLPEIPEVRMADYYQPAERLGGDFYNIINLDDILMGYVVDITGHGLDGSLLNIFVRETINSFLLSHFDLKKKNHLSELMKFITRKYQQEEFSDDYFISIILFELDKNTMELTYSNAGIHIPPLLITDGQLVSFEAIKEPPISSVIEFDTYEFKERSLQLEPGSSFLITTDGLVEEKVGTEQYSKERLQEKFLEYHSSSPQNIIELLINDFQNFSGKNSGKDDITLLILQRESD